MKRFVAETKKWKVGNPSDPSVDMGALISKEHLEKVVLHEVYLILSFVELQKMFLHVYAGWD